MNHYGLIKKECYNVVKQGKPRHKWFEFFKDNVYPYTGVGDTETIYNIKTKDFKDRDTSYGKEAEKIQMQRSFNTWFYAKSSTVLVPKFILDKNK
jgi:hypothetical protein